MSLDRERGGALGEIEVENRGFEGVEHSPLPFPQFPVCIVQEKRGIEKVTKITKRKKKRKKRKKKKGGGR